MLLSRYPISPIVVLHTASLPDAGRWWLGGGGGGGGVEGRLRPHRFIMYQTAKTAKMHPTTKRA